MPRSVVGDWKLVSESENNGTWELYDLKKDRIESNNLAGEYPEKVKEMAAQWERLAEEYRRQGEVGGNRSPEPARLGRRMQIP